MKEAVELEKLIKRAKGQDTDAVEEIINRFKKYVVKTAAEIYIKGYEMEDLIQEGYVSIIKAINYYNVDKKSFTAYITKSVRNNYYNEIRRMSKRNYEESLDKIMEEGREKRIHHFYNIEEEYIKKEELYEMKNALDRLTERERELIQYICKDERGAIKRYAKNHNIKYGTCYKIKSRIVKRLAVVIKEKNNKNI